MENLQEKVKALLLNRVEGARWNYFQIDTDAVHIEANQSPDATWFDLIQKQGGKWFWTGIVPPNSADIMKELVNAINENPRMLFEVMGDIYKLRDIENNSDADQGVMGTLNRKNSEARNRYFLDKMEKGFRDKPGNLVILAEGDSWFQFPRIEVTDIPIKDYVEDIGDQLSQKKDLAWYNLAYAGDWLSNMLYEGRYVTELDGIEPHVFLISGGGNDMVGGKRIKTFVKAAGPQPPVLNSALYQQLLALRTAAGVQNHPTFDQAKYTAGLAWLQDGFVDFLNVMYIQYLSLFVRVYKNTSKFSRLLTVTQGYDFAIPSDDNTKWIEFGHRLVNKFTGNGKWLKYPLSEKGIVKGSDQEAIVYTMIYEFNEMLLAFARANMFPNVAHIDNRGVAKKKDDWFDELHLESETFEKVAAKYMACFDDFRAHNGRLSRTVF